MADRPCRCWWCWRLCSASRLFPLASAYVDADRDEEADDPHLPLLMLAVSAAIDGRAGWQTDTPGTVPLGWEGLFALFLRTRGAGVSHLCPRATGLG